MATALTNERNYSNGDNRMYSCMFCQSSNSSQAELAEHLMLCGNKTDQCPKCYQFIRRAIFAYHYENNCANFNEFDTQIKSSVHSNLKDENINSQRSNQPTTKSGILLSFHFREI